MSDGFIENTQPARAETKQSTKTVETGEQTVITPKVKEVAAEIKGEGIIYAMNVADYIKSMGSVEDSKEPNFRRTADEVIESGEYDGCNEAGAVFAALLRTKGYPVTYVQALKTEAVKNYDPKNPTLSAHVFLEVDFSENGEDGLGTKVINSTTGEITEGIPEGYMVGARGLDAWDMGLKEGFGDLRKLFEEKQKELVNQDTGEVIK